MSGKGEPVDIQHTKYATHVYVKIDNPKNLGSKFEGPYEILERPSRSTVTIKVGTKQNNEPRTLTYHWSSCKPANLREGAIIAERPKLGRPKTIPEQRHLALKPSDADRTTSHLGSSNDTDAQPVVQQPVAVGERALTLTEVTPTNKPVRSTRNKNPRYT